MTLEELLAELRFLSKQGKGFKPHKHIALLTVLQLIREHKIEKPQIYFDVAFKNRFGELLRKYGSKDDRNRPHNPFFHLSSSHFWHLVPNEEYESTLAKIDKIGSAGDLERLVSHAKLDQTVFDLFSEKETGQKIVTELEACVLEGLQSRTKQKEVPKSQESYSLFQHEADALEDIKRRVSSHNLGFVLNNLELHDPQSNRYFETDLIVICTFGIYTAYD